MRWIDVAGAPGVGKSAILDSLWPRKLPWDGFPLPRDWGVFVELTQQLCARTSDPVDAWSHAAATFHKIATASRMPGSGVYVQHGLAQIGLELAWRLGDASAVDYYELMPVDAGVVFLFADAETVMARNRARRRDFSDRVPLMDAARVLGERVLSGRGVRLLSIDTSAPVEASRSSIEAFAAAA